MITAVVFSLALATNAAGLVQIVEDDARTHVERRRAIKRLGALNTPAAMRALVELLEDDVFGREAREALKRATPSKKAIAMLNAALAKEALSSASRNAIFGALETSDPAGSLDRWLVELKSKEKHRVRRAGAEVIRRAVGQSRKRAHDAVLARILVGDDAAAALKYSGDDLRPVDDAWLKRALSGDSLSAFVGCEAASGPQLKHAVPLALDRKDKALSEQCAKALATRPGAPPDDVVNVIVSAPSRDADFLFKRAAEWLPTSVAPSFTAKLLPKLKAPSPPRHVARVFLWAGLPEHKAELRAAFERTESRAFLEAFVASSTTRADLDQLFRYEDDKIIRRASGFLRYARHKSLASPLVPLLRHDDMHVRADVINALGQLAVEHTAVALLDVVEREDEWRRNQQAAVRALSNVASEDALARMSKHLLKGKHLELATPLVRTSRVFGHRHTQRVLNRGPPAAVTALLNALNSDVHPSDEVVLLAALNKTRHKYLPISGLAHLHTPGSRAALCRLVKQKDTATYAASALGDFGDLEAFDCLLAALSRLQRTTSTKERVYREMEQMSGAKLGNDLKAWRAWRKRGRLSGGISALIEDLAHDNANVRALSARELTRRALKRRAERAKTKRAIATRLRVERSDAVNRALADSARRLDVKSAIPALVDRLDTKNRVTRRALIRALDRLGDGRGTLALLREIESRDPERRREAAEDLSAVTGEPVHFNADKWRAWWRQQAERYRR